MNDLSKYAQRSTVKLTTRGRKSGEPRTVTIWFVVSAPNRVEVQHASAPLAQWYKNLVANPEVSLDFGDGPVRGRAQAITEPARIAEVLTAIRRKHWLAGPLIQWFGRKAKAVAAQIEV